MIQDHKYYVLVELMGSDQTQDHQALQALIEKALMDGQIEDEPVHVTAETFGEKVIESPVPVLVDFWAEWCGPCKQIGPSLEEISDEMGDTITVAKLNIDDNPSTPPRYGIRGIPTLMIFKDGQVQATKVGAVSKSMLTAFVDENI